MCEYIEHKDKYTYHLLTCLPTGTKCISRVYGKNLPKDYLYHDVKSNQLIKKTPYKMWKNEFPYIVITGDTIKVDGFDSKLRVNKIVERLSRIKR